MKHEKELKHAGAIEIGAGNSVRLAIAHTLFYIAALAEGWHDRPAFDTVSAIGLGLYIFGMVALLLVMSILRRLWTVKLLIAQDHVLITHPLFRLVRHPNYYLNLPAELIGYALVFHAYITLIVGLPIYLIFLATRIRQEEAAMSERFSEYGSST
jgi:isoprenylcysteine carboxyl methyltransferase (ICMT) family protein YpbQ